MDGREFRFGTSQDPWPTVVVVPGPQMTEELHQTGKLLLGASAPCWTGDTSLVAPLSLAPIVAEHADLDKGDRPGVALPSPLLVVAEHAQGDGPGVVLLFPAPINCEHVGDEPGIVPLSPLLVVAEHVGDRSGAVPLSRVLSELYNIVSYQLVSHSSLR